jgi:hypothetical protein
VNASFFTFTANARYPGDPVGLGLYDGWLLSEPAGDPAEADLVLDSRRNTVMMGQLRWTGSVRNARTRAALPIEFLNHPPVVPAACAAPATRRWPSSGWATAGGSGMTIRADRRYGRPNSSSRSPSRSSTT